MNHSIITIIIVALFGMGTILSTSCNEGGHDHGSEGSSHHEHEGEEGSQHHGEAESEHHDHDGSQSAASDDAQLAMYKCPMQCEGDKTYAEAGSCPECGMALEELKEDEHDHDHGEHSHDH